MPGVDGGMFFVRRVGPSGFAVSRSGFPFLPPGWLAEWTDDGLVMKPPPLEADRFQVENVV